MSDQLIKAAKIGFASQYTFFLKAQFYHWNVEGINFQELHALFERIYTEVYGTIDDFAEKIRACGGYAPSSNTRFNMLSIIDDAVEVMPAEQMVSELLADAENMVTIIKKVYDVAEAEGEHGFNELRYDYERRIVVLV